MNDTAALPEPSGEGEEEPFFVHACFTVGLFTVQARNETGALSSWANIHNIQGAAVCGQYRQQPYPHLEVQLELGGRPRMVNVVREAHLHGDRSVPPGGERYE